MKTGIICSVGLYQLGVVIRGGRERELNVGRQRPVGRGVPVRLKIPLRIVIFLVFIKLKFMFTIL